MERPLFKGILDFSEAFWTFRRHFGPKFCSTNNDGQRLPEEQFVDGLVNIESLSKRRVGAHQSLVVTLKTRSGER